MMRRLFRSKALRALGSLATVLALWAGSSGDWPWH